VADEPSRGWYYGSHRSLRDGLFVGGGLAVRIRRVTVRGGGVLMGLGSVLGSGSVIACFVMLRRFMVRLGCMLVVLGCFPVCFVCHVSSFPM
jgi:hypothetical protein